MELAIFLAFALLAVTSALVVVSHRNPVYSTMSLVITLIAVAALFVLLGAPLLAALQILVYTGAILVLFLFVIMLLNVGRESRTSVGYSGQLWGALAGATTLGLLVGALAWARHGGQPLAPVAAELMALRPLARALFWEYLLPFEIVGLLLLAAVVAATVLARRPEAGSRPERER